MGSIGRSDLLGLRFSTLTSTPTTMYAGLAVSSTSGGTTTATFDNVSISSTPDFYVTAWPISWTSSPAGGTSSYGLGIGGMNGFSGTVNFASVTGLPAGATWVVNPSSTAGPGLANLTITTAPGTPVGSYAFTVTASSGTTSHSTSATLTVVSGTGVLPLGWTSADVGNNLPGNSTSYANGVYTLTATTDLHTGIDNLSSSTTDELEFAYQPIVGGGSIVARVTGIPTGGSSALAGVIIRTGPTPSAANVAMLMTNSVLWTGTRTADGTAAGSASGNPVGTPYWVKVVWSGNTLTPYFSPDGIDWTALASLTLTSTPTTMYAGLAVSSTSGGTTTATFDNVTVTNTNSASGQFSLAMPAAATVAAGQTTSVVATITDFGIFTGPVSFQLTGLPSGATYYFSPATVRRSGATTLVIKTTHSTAAQNYTLTVIATGTINNQQVQHTEAVTLTVNSVTTQPTVVSVSPINSSGANGLFTFTASNSTGATKIDWMEALINTTLTEAFACYVHYDRASNIAYLRNDNNPSWAASGVLGGQGTLANSQCALDLATSSVSVSGTTFTLNLALSYQPGFSGQKNVYMLVDAQESSGEANSNWQTMGTWTVTSASGSLAAGWATANVGSGTPEISSYSGGVYTVSGQGNGVDASALDAFEFVYQPIQGSGSIVARVTGIQNSDGAQVGVGIRSGPTPSAANVSMVIANNGTQSWFGFRSADGAPGTGAWGCSVTSLPFWVQVAWTGTTLTALCSPDGTNWTTVGTLAFAPTTMYAGLVVSSGSPTSLTTATFDNVTITNGGH